MKQLIQDFSNGRVTLIEAPPPALVERSVLVQTYFSVVSAGTERSTVDLGKKNIFAKAIARPDLVAKLIEKARKEGLSQTFQKAKSKLESYKALGYSSAGVVLETGADVTTLKPGDRVACAGAEYAHHAQFVAVPRNLCVKVPDDVPLESAAFATLGAIALHAIRQARLEVGDTVAVLGLGLIGQLVVQLAKAAGCRVFGVDLKRYNVERALAAGADRARVRDDGALRESADQFTLSRGFDAVILTASGQSNDPIELAAEITRDRARVIVVGDLGLDLPRTPFYQKELEVRLSRSYGPGRYDHQYELLGNDYPLGFVRWTAQRNMEAFLQLVQQGTLHLQQIITHRFPIDEATHAYDLLTQPGPENYLGIVLAYPNNAQLPSTSLVLRDNTADSIKPNVPQNAVHKVRLGVIGAGNYCQGVLLPALARLPGVEFRGVVTTTSSKARNVLDRYGFQYCSCSPGDVLDDPDTNAVLIATRHNSHAELAARAIRAGKHVFVEKPLALSEEELKQVADAFSSKNEGAGVQLTVGFNRRFAPVAGEIRQILAAHKGPWTIQYRINAGKLPPDHWLLDPVPGGGRLLGECCHFIDFVQFLVGSDTVAVHAQRATGSGADCGFHVSMRLADGSLGSILYAVDGDPGFPKEHIEIFGAGITAVIDDFRHAYTFISRKSRKLGSATQNKGQQLQMASFIAQLLDTKPPAMSAHEVFLSSLATIQAQNSLQSGRWIEL